ncbi:MAG: hypothetical protein RML72_05865 [Bacteroidia bacterium]|nr:hypothetical protein [Bacteroidia bacterium]
MTVVGNILLILELIHAYTFYLYKESSRLIQQAFEAWKENNEQLDDICVIAFEV